MIKEFKRNALALAIGMSASSLACAGTIAAPYFSTGGFGSGAYKVKNLAVAKLPAVQSAFTYKALATHTAYAGAGWNPAATASLWQAVASCN